MVRAVFGFVACLFVSFSSANANPAVSNDSNLSFHVFALPRSDELEIQLKLKNNSDAEKILSFSSSKKYEIVIKSKKDEEVNRYSAGKQFLQAIQKIKLKPGQTYTWKETWNYKNKGQKIIRGDYSIEAILLSSKKTGEEIVAKTTTTIPLEEHPVFKIKKIKSSGSKGIYHLEGIARTANPVFYTVEDGHLEIISNKRIVIDEDGRFELDITIPKDDLPSNGSLILYVYDGNSNPLFVVLDVFL